MATLAHPLPGYPTPPGGEFGAPRALSMGGIHKGLDFAAPAGIPVRAAARGIVTRSLSSLSPISLANGAGNHIHVTHSDHLRTDYAHLLARYVREGDTVEVGQVIGAVGSSGFATGNHLHFGVIVDGQPVDPAPYLGLSPASAATLAGAPIDTSGGSLSAYPLEPGKTCPPGYNRGTVDPGFLANIPFNVWFNRPRNPDGTVNACIQVGLGPGDNAATAQAFQVVLPALLEPALNIAIVAGAAVLVWTGVKKALAV